MTVPQIVLERAGGAEQLTVREVVGKLVLVPRGPG